MGKVAPWPWNRYLGGGGEGVMSALHPGASVSAGLENLSSLMQMFLGSAVALLTVDLLSLCLRLPTCEMGVVTAPVLPGRGGQ